VNNIAYTNNGNTWTSMGQGVDNIINSVFVDSCSNVYIGGAFKNAGGVATGQVAIWNSLNNNWAPVGPVLASSTPNPVVNSVTVDCDEGCGACQVFIGGSFSYTLPDGT
jgi:hypothetical protein